MSARGATRPGQAGVSFPSLPWSASELAPKARLQTSGALPATLGTTAVRPKADATGWSGYLNAASKVLAIWTSNSAVESVPAIPPRPGYCPYLVRSIC